MKWVHFVGVSGIGMSAAAEITLCSDMKVSGSAIERNSLIDRLIEGGMEFFFGHKPEHVQNPDLVVASAAVPPDNPELLEAGRRGIPVYLYSQYLGMLMSEKRGIAVAGTHGKTTTTAILALMLWMGGINPTVVCGGVMKNFSSNALCGSGNYFLSEACEYNRSFLHLSKWYAIVTNIEADHLDYYRDINEIRDAFAVFLKETNPDGFLVVNGDDENLKRILEDFGKDGVRVYTVGYGSGNHYRVSHEGRGNGFYSVKMFQDGKSILKARVPVPGVFNCVNAALAAVCALNLGINCDIVTSAIESFKGTERRFELLGMVKGNPVYSDYAHHPTEIRSFLKALRERYPSRRIAVVFQPHQYSRTSIFFHEFIDALRAVDFLIITEIYRQRDSEEAVKSVSGVDLYHATEGVMGKRVVFKAVNEEIFSALEGLDVNGWVCAFMGAGDIDSDARRFVKINTL
ncbi:MAG: UDP-N-acetylmuramate--L-alanine ligase [Spirochaetota bacterium]